MALGHKTGGRKKGTPNKSTAAVKEALFAAYAGIGGLSALQTWAQANPTEFYKLWAKLLPAEVSVEGAVEIKKIERVIVDVTDSSTTEI